MTFVGRILEVTARPLGSAVAPPGALVGESLIPVLDVDDFDEEAGGTVTYVDSNGDPVMLDYTGVLEDAFTVNEDAYSALVLTAPLAAAVTADDYLSPVPGGVDKIAQVQLDEGEPIACRINSNLFDIIPEGIRDDATLPPEVVSVDDGNGDAHAEWVVVDILGAEPIRDLTNATGIPPAEPGYTEAPATSPVPVILAGSGAAVVKWESVARAESYELHVALTDAVAPSVDTLHTVNAHSPTWVTEAGGVAATPDRDLYFALVAKNSIGSAAASAWVLGRAGAVNADILSASLAVIKQVVAELVEAQGLKIGDHTWNETTGFTIPDVLNFPPGAGGDADITARLVARSLLIEDKFELRGTDNSVWGALELAKGLAAPKAGPTVAATWGDPVVTLDTSGGGGIYNVTDDGTRWIGAMQSGATDKVYAWDKATGVRSEVATLANVSGVYSVLKVGTEYYVSLRNTSNQDRVARYDATTWAFIASYTPPSEGYAAALATDGTYIYHAYVRASDGKNVVVRTSLTMTGATNVMVSSVGEGFTGVSGWNALYVGAADFGATRYVMQQYDYMKIFPAGLTAAEQTAQKWGVPQGEGWSGLHWDGANFWQVTYTGKVYKLGKTVTATARGVRYTQYDPIGTTHETPFSPSTAITQPPRQLLRVTTAAPNTTGLEPPTRIRHYVSPTGVGGTHYRQADVTASPWAAVYDQAVTTGATAASTPDFSTVAAPGILHSEAEFTPGASPAVYTITFNGDGTFRLGELTDVNTSSTAWTTVPYASGYNSHATTGALQVKRVGRVVYMRGGFTDADNSLPALNAVVATLPTGFRPDVQHVFLVPSQNPATVVARLFVNTDGTLQVITNGTIPYVSLPGTWPVVL